MGVSLYDILGVAPKATAAEIQAAYEDKTADGRALDASRSMALKEAFKVLSNPQRRAAYDQSLRSRTYERARAVAAEEEGAGWGRKALIAAAVALLAGGAWYSLKRPAAPAPKPVAVRPVPLPSTGSEAAVQPTAARDTGAPLSPEQLYAAVAPSIMRINVSRRDGSPVALGTGVVVEPDTVVTNCHVALSGDQVQVRDQQQALLPASIVVADEEFDLCKLRVSGLSAKPVSIGASTQLNVGQKVFAIGSPQGLDLTLSDGLVSSLRETPYGTVIQTTAPVSPGSSGGGLFDQRGRLVGIITFQMRSGQNLNFAIPVEWIDKMTNRRSDAWREQGAGPSARPTGDGQRD